MGQKHDFFDFLVLGVMCAIIWIMLNGCATISPPPVSSNPNAVYKYDLGVSVNGSDFSGTGVVTSRSDSGFDITISSRTDVDLFTVQSCHREFSVESAISTNWIHPRRSYVYHYEPTHGIEDDGSCLLRIGAYNKGQGQSAWAIIDFQTPEATLPVVSKCNGETDFMNNGVTICQSKAGLIQELDFKVPVKQALPSDPKCQMSSADGKTWTYLMPLGECVIAFQELGGEKKIHRLTTIGFSDVLVRGN